MAVTLRLKSALAILLANSTLTFAQATVTGTVIDQIDGHPIAGATVTLVFGRTLTKDLTAQSTLRTITGPDGRFTLHPDQTGYYWIVAEADGYERDQSADSMTVGRLRPFTWTGTLTLSRAFSISGQIVDDDTKQPNVGMNVTPVRIKYKAGQAAPAWMKPAITQADGTFQIKGLVPGHYLLELSSNKDQEYARQLFPKGNDINFTQPLFLTSDHPLGRISIAKEPLFTIRGRIVWNGCSPGESLHLTLLQQFPAASRSLTDTSLKCADSEYAIKNISPGSYDIVVAPDHSGTAQPRFFQQHVVIVNHDLDLDLSPSPPIPFSGIVEFPQGVHGPSITSLNIPSTEKLFARADGTFTGRLIPSAIPRLVDVKLPPLPPSYVSEVRYNGLVLKDHMLVPNPYAASHSIVIKVSDKPASLQGTLKEKRPNAFAVLLAWPLRIRNDEWIAHTTTINDGSFAFPLLAPGSYRLLITTQKNWDSDLQMPGALQAIAQSATEIELKENEKREITQVRGE